MKIQFSILVFAIFLFTKSLCNPITITLTTDSSTVFLVFTTSQLLRTLLSTNYFTQSTTARTISTVPQALLAPPPSTTSSISFIIRTTIGSLFSSSNTSITAETSEIFSSLFLSDLFFNFVDVFTPTFNIRTGVDDHLDDACDF